MQLFITEYKKKEKTVIIHNSDLLSQLRKVLRASIGDSIWIQNSTNEAEKTRYEVRIDMRDTSMLEGTILSEGHHEIAKGKNSMIIAMPNKWDKVELIVQKLSESSLDQIVFWPAERSVIKVWNPKKEERLHKIIKEAVEQSRGRIIPNLEFTTDITKYLQNSELIVFDKTGTKEFTPPNPPHGMEKAQLLDPSLRIGEGVESEVTKITGLVGPEGGLTPRDYQQFKAYRPKIVSLGETVLRMETAAIVGGWLLKNNEQLITKS